MARALVITNPAAARTEHLAVREIAQAFKGAGWHAEVLATGGPGDARRLAAYGVEQGVDLVAVFGGDGTTMQAAAALVGTEVPLGVIPGGTGNLLAGNLRLPAAPAKAVRAMVAGTPRPLDLGRVERDDGTHYFAVACGAGFDARVTVETAAAEKARWGIFAYLATALRSLGDLRSAATHLTIDGREFDANATMVLVANCGLIVPPFLRLHDDIAPDDGLLDVVVVRADGLAEGVQVMWEWLALGSPEGGRIAHARGHAIAVATDPVQPVELDGDDGGVTPFAATVVPGAIRVVRPPGD